MSVASCGRGTGAGLQGGSFHAEIRHFPMPQLLLTLPPDLHRYLKSPGALRPSWLRRNSGSDAFVTSDPLKSRLGSGGGTVNVLWEAWKAEGKPLPLEEWLGAKQRLVLHSGGESRRLPAYAGLGKAFLPLPNLAGLEPRIFDQTLSDFQIPLYRESLVEAGSHSSALVASGDVWLSFDPAALPSTSADIVGLGMRVRAEIAQDFGVFFVGKDGHGRPGAEREIEFFLQKPRSSEIQRLASAHDFLVDTGMWLLSARALGVLFKRCGWDERRQRFATNDGLPAYLDLYTEVGAALGRTTRVPPSLRHTGFGALTKRVVDVPEARFYHVGSTRQLLDSMEQMQWQSLAPQRSFRVGCAGTGGDGSRDGLSWAEGCLGETLPSLGRSSVVCGLPKGHRITSLTAGRCLDVLPVGQNRFVVRPYHIDDTFRGDAKRGNICGQAAAQWLAERGVPVTEEDVFQLPLYPLVTAAEITDELVEWFFVVEPKGDQTKRWAKQRRMSSKGVVAAMSFKRYFSQRREGQAASLRREFQRLLDEGDTAVFDQDFNALAEFCLREAEELRAWLEHGARAIEKAAVRPEHQARFILFLAKISKKRGGKRKPGAAFERLSSALVSAQGLGHSEPKLSLKADQIVWARSPVRLDLAGGWSDTPPYCLEQGGAVLNLSVFLNGQPPIQVFVRPTRERVIRLRSIDLGAEETIRSFKQLEDYRHPRGSFSLPKAALSLAGFSPEFRRGTQLKSLGALLKHFGSGLEISLLSAIPKGSGLGTSSIIGAALLAALNRACGLKWDAIDLYTRVLAVEQLLTTGGGWQDQAGAIFPGVKLIQTAPGLSQSPTVRYVPAGALGGAGANKQFLLYYTGATRVAKGILQEIVHDMFLNDAGTRRTLDLIRANAWRAHGGFQLGSSAAVEKAIARSWRLNKQLDPGTSTPEIERIIALCGDDLIASKLLGAGGGGYMLICAKNGLSGDKIREKLQKNPPNPRARFVDFEVAETGLEVTVS